MALIKKFYPVILLVIPIVIIFGNLNQIPFQPGAEYSDFSISHYSNYLFIQKSIKDFGEIPLWSPVIMAGYPFHADPLSGLLYPLGWLAIALPLPAGINLALAAHFYFGGLGVFYLSKKFKFGIIGSLTAGLAFELMPKLISHLAAGHVSLIFAFCLTPWVFFFSIPGKNKKISKFGAGIFLGLIFLADPRWFPYVIIPWFLWFLFQNGFLYIKRFLMWSVVKQVMISIIIALPLLLPLLKFSSLSTRADLSTQERMIFSLPIIKILNMVIPSYGDTAELVDYFGIIIFVALFSIILLWKTNKELHFLVTISLVLFIISFGDSFFFTKFIFKLPFADLLRVPTRGLLFVCFTSALFYGWFIENIDKLVSTNSKRLLVFCIALLIILSAILALSYTTFGRFEPSVITPTIILSLLIICLFLSKKNITIFFVEILVACIIMADLFFFEQKSLEFRPVLHLEPGVSEKLVSSSDFRIYSPSYSVPQWQAVEYGLKSVDAVSPLQLKNYTEFMDAATGVPRSGYSVTIPSFKNGKPSSDNIQYQPNLTQLGLLNVEYIVSDYPIQVDGLSQIENSTSKFIYRNSLVSPRIWVERSAESNNTKVSVDFQSTNNKISANVNGPGKLYISQNYYPGWIATIDGEPTAVKSDKAVLVFVDVPEGNHDVDFNYSPIDFYIALGVASLLWSFIILDSIFTRRVRKL